MYDPKPTKDPMKITKNSLQKRDCLFWEFYEVILRTNFSYTCLYP